ncbi:MAG: hypothetical protein M1832_000735 [Thelocarpon impressellum]|nr:MAG: hypothetical protein M1832_000735 [Thelocarpon impressellum]
MAARGNASKVVVIALLAYTVVCAPVKNTDPDPDVHCKPTKWFHILLFFTTNYFIHAATVRSLPGENAYASSTFKFACLLAPFTGIRRGLNIILRASALSGDALHAAARANALCMVVRSKDWRPKGGDLFTGCEVVVEESEVPSIKSKRAWASAGSVMSRRLKRSVDGWSIWFGRKPLPPPKSKGFSDETALKIKAPYNPREAPRLSWSGFLDWVLQSYRFRNRRLEEQIVARVDIEVHGVCELTPGYALCYVPHDMAVRARGLTKDDKPSVPPRLSAQFNFLKVMWSVSQTSIGCYTLWQARGSQLNKYGYASYGLTVIPYVIMSMINLVGSLISREYEDLYLVHSDILDEAIDRGSVVDGVVGTICPLRSDEETTCADDEQGRLGDAKVEITAISKEDPSSLRYTRLDGPPGAATETLLKLEKVPEPTPRAQSPALAYLKWLLGIRALFRRSTYRCTKRETTSPAIIPRTTVTIPSHGSFRRVPPLRFQGAIRGVVAFLFVACLAGPYVLIYLMTGWRVQQATGTQSSYALQWLICGQIQGYFLAEVERDSSRAGGYIIATLLLIAYGSSAVGGLVVVAVQMIDFGYCTSS